MTRLTKAQKQAADVAAKAEWQRLNKIRADRDHECEQHTFAFVRKHVPDFDPTKGSPMAVEYFDDLPKWLHEMLTDAERDAEQAATAEAEAAARAAAEKTEQETHLATFKRVFDERIAEAIAKREGRWVYDKSNNYEGRMLEEGETLIDGKAVKMTGTTKDPKLAKLFTTPARD